MASPSPSSSTPGPRLRASRPRRTSSLTLMFAAWGAAAMASSAVPKASAASIERSSTLRRAAQSLVRRKAILSDSDMVTIAGKVPLDAIILIGAALLFALVCMGIVLVGVQRGERGEVALERKQARRDLRIRGSSSTSGHSSPRRGSKEKVAVAASTVNSTATAASSTAPLIQDAALDFPQLEQVTSTGSRALVMSSSRAGHRISSAGGGYRVSMVGQQRKSLNGPRRPDLADMKRTNAYGESRRSLHRQHQQQRYHDVDDVKSGPPRPGSKYRSRTMSDDAVLQVPVLRPHRSHSGSSRDTETLTDLEIQAGEDYASKRRPAGPRAPSDHRRSTTVARGVNLASQRSLGRKKQPVPVNPQSVERSYSASRPGNHRSSSSRDAARGVASVTEPFGKIEIRRSDSDLGTYVDTPMRQPERGSRYDMLSTSSSFTSPSLRGAPLSPPEAVRAGFETPPAERDSPEITSAAPWMGSDAWKGFMNYASGGQYSEAPTTETPVRRGSSRRAGSSSLSYHDADATSQHQGWRSHEYSSSAAAPGPPAPNSRYHNGASASPPKMAALLPTTSNERPSHRRMGTGSSAGRPRGARPMGGTYDVDVEALGAHDDQHLL